MFLLYYAKEECVGDLKCFENCSALCSKAAGGWFAGAEIIFCHLLVLWVLLGVPTFFFSAILSDSGNDDTNQPTMAACLPGMCIARGVLIILIFLSGASISDGDPWEGDSLILFFLFCLVSFIIDMVGGSMINTAAFTEGPAEREFAYGWLVAIAVLSFPEVLTPFGVLVYLGQ